MELTKNAIHPIPKERGFLAEIRYNIEYLNSALAERIKKIFRKKGYLFNEGIYVPNIIGVRSNDMTPEEFNDYGLLIYRNIYNKIMIDQFEMTTDPGLYYLQNPLNIKGTGILAPQQIIGGLAFGKHRGYDALCQNKPFMVYRDNNKDRIIDMTKLVSAPAGSGFNLHRACESVTDIARNIGKFSAGCQVVMSSAKFNLIMDTCRLAKFYNGLSAFNYTLLEEKDFC